MSYFAPYIDSSGLHIPTYIDILEELVQQTKSIYGEDIYLGYDSQDYQFISIFALKIYDTFQILQLAYLNRAPSTAIGVALDGLVKFNGILRSIATYSTCVVTLEGDVGALIQGGVIQDVSGYLWNLPSSVTIGSTGSVNATATCQIPGAISANPDDLSKIVTPTYGWSSVTNEGYASLGEQIETDSQLRARQTQSTARPSRSILEGIKGDIASITGVTRVEVYENDTNIVDLLGLPAHSITVVVENGDSNEIATVISSKKGPGCYTDGTTEVVLADSYGQLQTIRFFRPTYVYPDVVINVKQLTGYTTSMTQLIKEAVIDYFASLSIGVDYTLSVSSLWGVSLSVQNLSKPIFSVTSITIAKHNEAQSTNDIIMLFNEAIQGNIDYITINVT